jgi:flagellar biosynthetic protein FliO
MDAIQPFAAIILVMALLGGALWALKKRGGATMFRTVSSPRRLEVVERISLGPHHSLHLVRAGDQLLLIATAPNSCQLLNPALKETL